MFQLVVSNEMGSLEEVITVSLAEMEDGEISIMKLASRFSSSIAFFSSARNK